MVVFRSGRRLVRILEPHLAQPGGEAEEAEEQQEVTDTMTQQNDSQMALEKSWRNQKLCRLRHQMPLINHSSIGSYASASVK